VIVHLGSPQRSIWHPSTQTRPNPSESTKTNRVSPQPAVTSLIETSLRRRVKTAPGMSTPMEIGGDIARWSRPQAPRYPPCAPQTLPTIHKKNKTSFFRLRESACQTARLSRPLFASIPRPAVQRPRLRASPTHPNMSLTAHSLNAVGVRQRTNRPCQPTFREFVELR
jgi:hypothetical protein